MSAPRTVIESCHVPRFTVAPGATLDAFLDAWAHAYVVARSWLLASLHPPTLTEDARREIEEAVNRDLADAGRPERVDVFAEMGAGPMDLVLRWRQRETAPADAAPSPEEPPALSGEVWRGEGIPLPIPYCISEGYPGPGLFVWEWWVEKGGASEWRQVERPAQRAAIFAAWALHERARAAAREQALAAEVERLRKDLADQRYLHGLAESHVERLRAEKDAAVLAEREACAKLADAFAATEDKSAAAATSEGWRNEARAMAKAARMVADEIRGIK